ncbi:MAG: hypothetical protein MUC72_03845 [Acidobacteria bacterium]|jgi:hypothetical protein|nr:hypothetical protein [Acidobacteriota bacterium]
MLILVECPVCGEEKEFPADAAVGMRRGCRRCWAVLEIRALVPLEVAKIPLCAEDFGI